MCSYAYSIVCLGDNSELLLAIFYSCINQQCFISEYLTIVQNICIQFILIGWLKKLIPNVCFVFLFCLFTRMRFRSHRLTKVPLLTIRHWLLNFMWTWRNSTLNWGRLASCRRIKWVKFQALSVTPHKVMCLTFQQGTERDGGCEFCWNSQWSLKKLEVCDMSLFANNFNPFMLMFSVGSFFQQDNANLQCVSVTRNWFQEQSADFLYTLYLWDLLHSWLNSL